MENPTRVSRLVVYALIGVAAIAVIWSLNLKSEPQEYLSISELAQLIKENKVSELIVSGDGRNVTVEYGDANLAETQSQISDVSSLEEILSSYGISESDYIDGEPVITYEDIDTTLIPPRPRLYGLVGGEVIEQVWKERQAAADAGAIAVGATP